MWALSPVTSVLMRQKRREHTGRRSHMTTEVGEGGMCPDAQGRWSLRRWKSRKEPPTCPSTSRGSTALPTSGFQTSGLLHTGGDYISVVLSHPACGHLLLLPQDVRTHSFCLTHSPPSRILQAAARLPERRPLMPIRVPGPAPLGAHDNSQLRTY